MDNNKIFNNNNEVVNAIQKSSNEIHANIGATISVVNTTPNVQALVTLAQTLSDNLPLMSAPSSILSSTTFAGGFQNNVFFDVVTENSAKQFKLNIINEVNSSNSHNCKDRNSKNINNINNRSNDTCSNDNQNKNVAFNNYSGAGPRIVSYVENGHLHVDVESVKCTDSLYCQSANPDKKQVANLDRSFDNDQKTNGASKDDDDNIFSYKENEDDGGMIQNTESEFEFESTEADQYKMEPEADQMNDDENCNNDGFENDNINIGCHATNESLNNHHDDSSDEAADEVDKLSFISNINFSSSNNVNRNSIINNTSIVSDTNFAGNSINFINDLKLNGVPLYHHGLQAVSGGNFIDNAKLFNESNSNIQNYNHYDNKKSNYFNDNADKNIVNCNIKDMIGDNKKKDFDSVFDDLNKKVVNTEGLMASRNSVPDQFTHGKFAVDCLQGDGVFLASCDCEMNSTNNLSTNNEKIFDDASAMHLSNKKNISTKDIKCDEPISRRLFGMHLNNEYVTSNCKDGGDNNESSSHGNQLAETQSLPLFSLSNSLMASPSSLSSPSHHFKIKASSLVSLEEGAKNHLNKINFFHSNIDDDEGTTFCSVKHQNKDYFKKKRQWNEISLTSISMDSNMTPSNHFIGDVDVDLNSWDHISSGCARQKDSTNFGTNFSNTSSQKCHFLQLHHANYQPRTSSLLAISNSGEEENDESDNDNDDDTVKLKLPSQEEDKMNTLKQSIIENTTKLCRKTNEQMQLGFQHHPKKLHVVPLLKEESAIKNINIEKDDASFKRINTSSYFTDAEKRNFKHNNPTYNKNNNKIIYIANSNNGLSNLSGHDSSSDHRKDFPFIYQRMHLMQHKLKSKDKSKEQRPSQLHELSKNNKKFIDLTVDKNFYNKLNSLSSSSNESLNRNGGRSQSSNKHLMDAFQNEELKRQHCESLVMKLQKELLTLQQNLEVSRKMEMRKNVAIQHIDQTVANLMDEWMKENEALKRNVERQGCELTTIRTFAQEQHRLITRYEIQLKASLEEGERMKIIHQQQVLNISQQVNDLKAEVVNMRHEKNEAFKELDQWKKKYEEANNKMISMQTDVCQYERDVNDINVKHLHELQVMQSDIQQNQLKLAEQNNIIEKLTDELREMKKIKEENSLVLEQKKLLGLEVNKMKLEHNEMMKVLSEKFQSDLNAQLSDVRKKLADEQRTEMHQLHVAHENDLDKVEKHWKGEVVKLVDAYNNIQEKLSNQLEHLRNQLRSVSEENEKLKQNKDVITRSLQSMLHIQHQQSFNLQSNKDNIAYIDEDFGKCNVEFDNILSLDKNNVRQSRNLLNNNFDHKQLQENFITTNDLRNIEELDVAQTDLKKYNNVNSNPNLYANEMNVLELDRKLVNNSQASDALCFIQGNLLSPFSTSNEMSKCPLSPSKSSVIRIKCHPTTTMSTETSIHNCKNINKPAKKQNFEQYFQRKYITKQHNIANRINNKQTDGKLSPFQDQHQISNCPSNSDFINKNHFKNNMKNKNKKLNNELMNNIHKITTSGKALQNNVEPCTPSTKLTSFQNDRQQFNHFDQNRKIGTVEYGDHFRNEKKDIQLNTSLEDGDLKDRSKILQQCIKVILENGSKTTDVNLNNRQTETG